jgi:PEP-CTERM motif
VRSFNNLPTIALLLVATASVAAHADSFNFAVNGGSGSFNGTGTFTTTSEGGGQFLITDISGTGVTALIVPNGFNGNDNLLFPSTTPTLDSHGFSFTDVNGPDHFSVNIFSNGSGYSAFFEDEDQFTATVPVTFTVSPATTVPPPSAVPEPSTLLLLGTGIFSLAAILRRKLGRGAE